jgi:hypothetical protein
MFGPFGVSFTVFLWLKYMPRILESRKRRKEEKDKKDVEAEAPRGMICLEDNDERRARTANSRMVGAAM